LVLEDGTERLFRNIFGNYHSTLRNIQEESRSHLHGDGSLKSRTLRLFWESNETHKYRGADKSLARPDWKNHWKFAIFRPTPRSLLPWRPGWTDNLLNCFWVACKS